MKAKILFFEKKRQEALEKKQLGCIFIRTNTSDAKRGYNADYEVPPRWSSPYRGEGAYPLRSSNQSASTKRAQLSVAAKVARPTDLLNNVKT